ncbi:putative PKHD-type hydroxylase [Trifolium pratense]|uniref:Putative PKHD-type hydroxylase n=1 Tax=Trifolium pratense TaxID=57577 RepID=A0A2K3P720_TRIPR|nr:putative PKHD-type hydroxylase [Trifolium pratense]
MYHHQNGSLERRAQASNGDIATNNVVTVISNSNPITTRLLGSPRSDHMPDNYEDLPLDFNPLVFTSLERHLPPHVINLSKDVKAHYMSNILLRYLPHSERTRMQKQKEYRQKIILNYPVDHFERWVHETKFRIMRPNTMNQYGAVLDDFGLENMLDKLMNDFIRPLAGVFFSEIGGSTLDSHHGFVVEYGTNRDVDLGFHVDDAEVTLNICLGTQFSGGELFFRGVRCDEHVNTETQTGEIFDYSHVPGHAVLHSGRHRHGARPTISGNRINLILWCRSSAFREIKKYQREFPNWCGECRRKKKERERVSIAATKEELLKRELKSAS